MESRKRYNGRQAQPTFSLSAVQHDEVGNDVGYWFKEIVRHRAKYCISITRETDDLYTVSALTSYMYEDTPEVHIAGDVSGLSAAVDLANETVEALLEHDLFITIANANGVGEKVLIRR